MSYVAQISEGDNLGSLREIYLAVSNWLSGVSPVNFKSGKVWEAIDFMPEMAGIKDSSKETPNGTEYTYQVVFLFNKQNAALYAAMKKYVEARGIIYCIDNNGLGRILGTPDAPVTFTYDADTGEKYNSMNYYKIVGTWVSSEMAVVV
ncbi:MAG: hypothetical protein V4619_15460 [Bacteroidota bacterium]